MARARGGFAQNLGGFAHNLFSSSSSTQPFFYSFDYSLEMFEGEVCLYFRENGSGMGQKLYLEGKWVSKFFFGYFKKWVSYLNFEEFKVSFFFFPHFLIGCIFFSLHMKHLGNNRKNFVTITHDMY